MSLNDPRWGHSPGGKPEDGSGSPEPEERLGKAAPGAGEDRPEPSGDKGGQRPETPGEGGEDRREPEDRRESRESAKSLEAEWQSFNDLLKMLMRGAPEDSGEPGGEPPGEKAPGRKPSRGKRPGGVSPRLWMLAGVACLFAVGAYLGAGFYTVPSGHSSALYSLGKFSKIVGPGTHWHLPWPFEKVRLIDTRLVHRTEANFTGTGRSSYLLTADGCLAELRGSLQWKVKPDGIRSYLERTDNPALAVESAFRRSLRQEFSFLTAHDVVTGRASLAQKKIAAAVQAEADRLGLGVEVIGADIAHAGLPKGQSRDAGEQADDKAFAIAQARAAVTDRIAENTVRLIRENAASYAKRVVHVAKTDAEFLRFLHSHPSSAKEKGEGIARAWDGAMEAAVPSRGELSNVSAEDILKVIRQRRGADEAGLRKVPDGAVTMEEILASRKRESFERGAGADGAGGKAQGSETRDTTADRREYLRRRGR